ncbi:MAG: hypothetical protein QOH35_3445 [Acidobacteriaceae bacterium]|jgi:hypothetical protein|nr:hypothetical protein [Acidobacteriaceae bacterium]MEA2542079.1 hypothetical protein [Acidobacteriaceae bacterium]
MGDDLEWTPWLRHAGRLVIGDTSACFHFRFIDEQVVRCGSAEILEGFPRPVGAVVNLLLVFHGFHQRHHFLWDLSGHPDEITLILLSWWIGRTCVANAALGAAGDKLQCRRDVHPPITPKNG